MDNDIYKKVENARSAFAKTIREFRKLHGVYLDSAQPLKQSLLKETKVFSDRHVMLSSGIFNSCHIWAEIGVDQAAFSKEILSKIHPKKLHLIDIDISRICMDNISEAVDCGVVEIHSGNSSDIIDSFARDYFDVIYIDGDHYYNGVRNDINASFDKVKNGGYLIFNDYAVWSPGSMSKCGVAKAVTEFANKNDWSVTCLALQVDGYYDLVLQRP